MRAPHTSTHALGLHLLPKALLQDGLLAHHEGKSPQQGPEALSIRS